MNVKIENKYSDLLDNLDIDFIKSIKGEFSPEEIVMQFSNFFFNKMILDITSIRDYQDITKIQELSVNMDMSKVILLLDDSETVNSPRYLSQLVSMGIYNFTQDVNALKFLIDNPNSYKDVAQYHQLNNISMPSNPTNVNDSSYLGDTSSYNAQDVLAENTNLRIIGIKNVTEHAGATTLTYMLKKELEKKYKVIALEIDDNDFVYFNDHSLKHTNHLDFSSFIATNYNCDVILVDLNDKGPINACTEVLYLIEPGLIQLNKLIRRDRKVFDRLKGKKLVLNRSVLDSSDVADFEYESHSSVYYNIPYLDDKLDTHKVLTDLLIKMGFARLDVEGSDRGGKLFSIFK